MFVSRIGRVEDDSIAVDGEVSVGGLEIELDHAAITQLVLWRRHGARVCGVVCGERR